MRILRHSRIVGDARKLTVHPDGTEDHQIAVDVAKEPLLPDWSPDGGRLVFTRCGVWANQLDALLLRLRQLLLRELLLIQFFHRLGRRPALLLPRR